MAAGDYNVADRPGFQGSDVVTANDKAQETVQETPDADAETFRATTDATRRTAAFVGYAAALEAHARREDIEGMESRVRRDTGIAGAAFANQDHMRGVPSDTAPTPGSVNGVAPHAVTEALRTATGTVEADDSEAEAFAFSTSEPTEEEKKESEKRVSAQKDAEEAPEAPGAKTESE
jgi:hypothetical protein